MKGTHGPSRLKEKPEALPLFPLAGALLLPGGQLPLNIFEPRYLAMVDAAPYWIATTMFVGSALASIYASAIQLRAYRTGL